MSEPVTIVGAGLAGSECAWQLARRGHRVRLFEMRPKVATSAHQTDRCAELVCSNSFRSDNPRNAVGLLKREMEALDSLIIRCARRAAVPAGDATARNFVRAGRALKIELFSDSTCATPLAGADGGAVSVNVAGLLPVSAASMSGQPWPVLAAASATALTGLKGAVNATVSFGPIWSFPRGDVAVQRVQLCSLDAGCANKLAELELAGNASTAALKATIGLLGLDVKDYKLMRLMGRTSDGLVLQLDNASCSGNTIANQPC